MTDEGSSYALVCVSRQQCCRRAAVDQPLSGDGDGGPAAGCPGSEILGLAVIMLRRPPPLITYYSICNVLGNGIELFPWQIADIILPTWTIITCH